MLMNFNFYLVYDFIEVVVVFVEINVNKMFFCII